MVVKQLANSGVSPDGSQYVVVTDGAGNLAPSSINGYPNGATPVTISAVGTTGAVVATLPGVASKTTYISGFNITSDATASVAGTATITGTISGTMSFRQGAGVTPAIASTGVDFNFPIPASAVNTAIVVTSVAAGTGGNTTVTAWGFQL